MDYFPLNSFYDGIYPTSFQLFETGQLILASWREGEVLPALHFFHLFRMLWIDILPLHCYNLLKGAKWIESKLI